MNQAEIRLDKNKAMITAHLNGYDAEMVYRIRGEKLYLLHTWVPEQISKKGIAKAMANKAFEFAEEFDFIVVPLCRFSKNYLDKSPEWQKRLRIGSFEPKND